MTNNNSTEFIMDIQHLRYFHACCQHLNFSKAARNLYLSRQALSKAMHDLETRLGEPLFNAHQGNLELTPFGQYLLKSSKPVMEAYNEFSLSLQTWKMREKNRLRIAVGVGALTAISYDIFIEFQSKHPDIPLSLEDYSDRTVLEMVENSQAELGVLSCSPGKITGFDSCLIQPGDLYLQINRSHPLAAKELIEIADLKDEPFVSLGTDNEMHNFFVEKCHEEGYEPNFIIITQDSNLANRMVINNQAISFGHIQNLVMTQNPMIRMIQLHLKETDIWGTFAIQKKGQQRLPVIEELTQYLSVWYANRHIPMEND